MPDTMLNSTISLIVDDWEFVITTPAVHIVEKFWAVIFCVLKLEEAADTIVYPLGLVIPILWWLAELANWVKVLIEGIAVPIRLELGALDTAFVIDPNGSVQVGEIEPNGEAETFLLGTLSPDRLLALPGMALLDVAIDPLFEGPMLPLNTALPLDRMLTLPEMVLLIVPVNPSFEELVFMLNTPLRPDQLPALPTMA